MYLFGLSKEEVLSEKHVASSHKETLKQNPMSTVTLFGRQVFPVKSSPKLMMRDIDLRLPPADHYTNLKNTTVEMGFHSAFEAKEAALATSWSGHRNPKIVIDLEEPPATEHADSISYSNLVKLVDHSIVEEGSDIKTNMKSGLLDLNRTPPADESVSKPRYTFLQDLNCPYIEETETSCEKSGVDDDPTPLFSPKCQNVDEKDGTASPASYTSCCTTENNLRTQALDPSCRTRLEFPATEVSPENECCNEEEEFSDVIQMAAESLVHLSAVSYQDQESKHVSSSQDQDMECCSCDSYELHTLGIRETNIEEEFSVSSTALHEINNITRDNNKEFGLKLRRGRRMKNFQKEILPSLTSLSRHEIREDINILEAVLRSREYKKMQGKTKDVKLGANQRNKRSVSQRYVGKKSKT
ncbi:T284 protein [Hirschfeldia incana]|nr:T284 protein [Hirschfeldia incana]